jgi:nicotinamidase-related amidase
MEKRFLSKENVYLHVVDVQKSLMAKILGAEGVAETVAFVFKCAQILKIPVVANTQYKKGLGPYVEELQPLFAEVPVYDKVEFNALGNNETAGFVDKLPKSVDTGILVGVETHICIYQTAVGLLNKGLNVWVVSDGVSSRSQSNHLDGLNRLRDLGAIVGSSEMLVYEMLGAAGSPEFKEVLPYIIARDA